MQNIVLKSRLKKKSAQNIKIKFLIIVFKAIQDKEKLKN